jgi:hypothetical protein
MTDQNFTTFKVDFTPSVTSKIRTVREIANEFELGGRIKNEGKKKHIDDKG